jgi:hypothetical protein
VPANRQNEGDVIAQGRPPRGDHRQAPAEADAYQSDPPVRCEVFLRGSPGGGLFDGLGHIRRDLEVDYTGELGRDDPEAHGRQAAGGQAPEC